jgi:hypothetical protein
MANEAAVRDIEILRIGYSTGPARMRAGAPFLQEIERKKVSLGEEKTRQTIGSKKVRGNVS